MPRQRQQLLRQGQHVITDLGSQIWEHAQHAHSAAIRCCTRVYTWDSGWQAEDMGGWQEMKWVDTAQPAMAQHRRRGGYRPAFVVTKTVTSCDLGIAQQQLIYIYITRLTVFIRE